MEAPILIKPIPNQVVNEQAAFAPFNLKEFIETSEAVPTFSAEVKGGAALPKGMICTSDGILTGIPAKETQGNYEIIVTITNEAGSIETSFFLTIKPSLTNTEMDYIDQLKAQVWQALENRLPVPEFDELLNRPITELDIYYLLERWGVITVWDAFNLDPPGEKKSLTLEGASPHYHVYDRGSCLIAAPRDLYSYERTIEDGLMTARALAREVYKRNWTVELTGLDRLTRAAWVEIQYLGETHGRLLDVINFKPSPEDVKLLNNQVLESRLKGTLE